MNKDLILSTGANESPFDPRTVNHDNLTLSGAVPLSFQIDYTGKPHKNQLKNGVCTAAASDVVAEWYQKTGFLGSIEWLYKIGKILIDGNTEEGSSIFTMLKAAQKYGIPSEANYPSNFNRPYSEFIANVDISQAMLDEASKNRIPGYASVPLNPDSLMKAIYLSKGGIIIRMALGDTFWVAEDGTITWDSKKIDPIRPPKIVTSGHAIAMVGWDNFTGKFMCRVRNSWGDTWNLGGDGTFDFAVMSPFITEAWTILDKAPVIKFLKDLKIGMTDSDVKRLQQFLNSHQCPVSSTGPGSPGNETDYFGPATQRALIKFQTVNNIHPNIGYCGILTRNKINSII